MTEPAQAKLYYFAGRGKGEAIRLLMAEAGISWVEEHIRSREQWLQLRDSGVLPYLQVPLLEIDGLKLVQSKSIVRYLARRSGLYPTDIVSCYKVDMLMDGIEDLRGTIGSALFRTEDPVRVVAFRIEFR
jgi:glutathione S-transferase